MATMLDLRLELIVPELAATTKAEVLAEFASLVTAGFPELECEVVVRTLQEREKLGSTGIGDGIAIPHGKLKGLERLILAFGRSRTGVDFNSLDGRKVHLFFLLLAPEDASGLHLKALARISRLMKDPAVRTGLMAAADAAAIHVLLREQDRRF
ncbi:MAG TPA: PTS sugar transporter subunit IIA [Geobacteraceae bacterium]